MLLNINLEIFFVQIDCDMQAVQRLSQIASERNHMTIIIVVIVA